jgi:hypothetical protein
VAPVSAAAADIAGPAAPVAAPDAATVLVMRLLRAAAAVSSSVPSGVSPSGPPASLT